MLDTIIDFTKNFLHKFASSLGEDTIACPHKSKKAAIDSINLDLPAIQTLLPYEYMTQDLLFKNKTSVGFGIELMPLAGADEALVKSLAQMLKNKLSPDVCATFMLHKHSNLEACIEEGFKPSLNKGGIFKELAKISFAYHKDALNLGYPNRANIDARLSDYRVYLFLATNKKSDINLTALRENIESELAVAGFQNVRIARDNFLRLMQSLVSPGLLMNHQDDEDLLLSHAITNGNCTFSINDLSIDISASDKDGLPLTTRVINCQIESLPQELALWQTPDLYANLMSPEHGISCPFLISFSINGACQDKMQALSKSRAKSLNSNANAVQNFLNPNAKDERAAWNFIYEKTNKGELSINPTFYNLVLFTNPGDERKHVAKAIGSFRQLGFELRQARATQWIRYLGSLPFFMSEGFFRDFEMFGLTKTMSNYNIANTLPVIAEPKGSNKGLLLPTYRNQLFYLDTFDNQSLPITNYNFLTIGSSGAGKSVFQQAQILSGLALGEITFVIDLGHSYKHLCELVGGTYIDAANISLNPFTLFDFKGTDGLAGSIQIRDLLAIMASPHIPVCDVQKSYLLDAAIAAWEDKGRGACIDDVIANLGKIGGDRRLRDLGILLKKYAKDGVYGNLFNGETQIINKSQFVVFEMSGFQHDPDLLTIVMFVMIVIIQGQFYNSERHLKKRCIIDEAWRFLTSGTNPIAAQFIEQGFRTARKYNGGFGVITQYLLDTEKTIQGQAIAASSDIKIIMRQGNFKEYVRAYPNRFNKYQQMMISSFGDVSGRGFASLMLEVGNTYSFHRYFLDPYLRLLFSSSGDEFMAIENKLAQGKSISDAISEALKEASLCV